MNTITHTSLTEPAHKLLTSFLESHGNVLSTEHAEALHALLNHMTAQARGDFAGRYAVGLDTGLGKTSAIACWVASLFRIPNHDISVSVAAQRVESLCELKRTMIELGVPAESIGLVHSYKHWEGDPEDMPEGYATEPAEFEDRPIVLVSHTRVRRGRTDERHVFAEYNGEPRSLMLYDESLIVSESMHIGIKELRRFIKSVDAIDENWAAPIHDWLVDVMVELDKLTDTLEDTKHADVSLPMPDFDTEFGLRKIPRALLPEVCWNIKDTLLRLLGHELRVSLLHSAGAVMKFQTLVPSELKNILVLDASYPIRTLVQESGIQDAERTWPLETPLAELKSYENVTWRVMGGAGGRGSMTRAFARKSAAPVVLDIIDVVKQIPEDECALFFTYKPKRKGKDFRAILQKAMSDHGIDPHATVDGKPRFNWLTWGNETGSNKYAHCKHGIMVGIMQRNPHELEALLCGQRGDLQSDVKSADVAETQDSETAHLAHQGSSRLNSRHVHEGKAGEATIWAIHYRPTQLRTYLNRVQSGVKWLEWEGRYSAGRKTQKKSVARLVTDYLKGCELDRISVQKLKADLELTKLASKSWQRGRDEALLSLDGEWSLEGRAFVKDRADWGCSF